MTGSWSKNVDYEVEWIRIWWNCHGENRQKLKIVTMKKVKELRYGRMLVWSRRPTIYDFWKINCNMFGGMRKRNNQPIPNCMIAIRHNNQFSCISIWKWYIMSLMFICNFFMLNKLKSWIVCHATRFHTVFSRFF